MSSDRMRKMEGWCVCKGLLGGACFEEGPCDTKELGLLWAEEPVRDPHNTPLPSGC